MSTNIAETGITIDDVVCVIDSGKVKEKSHDAISCVSTLRTVWISKASAVQRRGIHFFPQLLYVNCTAILLGEYKIDYATWYNLWCSYCRWSVRIISINILDSFEILIDFFIICVKPFSISVELIDLLSEGFKKFTFKSPSRKASCEEKCFKDSSKMF